MSGPFLNFIEQSNDGRKTKLFYVYNKTQPGSNLLGIVKFKPTWRRYVYESGNADYDIDCMLEIVDFLKRLMDERDRNG